MPTAAEKSKCSKLSTLLRNEITPRDCAKRESRKPVLLKMKTVRGEKAVVYFTSLVEFRCLEPWAKIEVKGFADSRKKIVSVCECSLRKERERKNSRGGKGRESWRIQHKSRAFEKYEGWRKEGRKTEIRRQKILFLSHL